jgi:hypothetical protein
MRGAIPPLPQYASMEWCSVKKSTNVQEEEEEEEEASKNIYFHALLA